MIKIKIIDWPLQTENNEYKGGYIFINPIHIIYISPYYDKQDDLYTLVMDSSNSFLINKNSLHEIFKYKDK